MTDTRQQPTFSIIVPLEFHRGQADACVRAWTAQAYPRDRYEVILAAPTGFPAEDLRTLKASLTPGDRLIVRPGPHDMLLIAEGARVAGGEALFFTESHCRPEPDVLSIAAGALGAHPEWSGFSCRSVRITHNTLSTIEADLYEADIIHGMTSHPWRKILDQCFVVRRTPYFDAGGFDATLGHFAEWMLAARFHRMGFALGYVPDARIHHFYSGELEDWREFTRDFVRGEIRALARGDADAFANLFDPVPEWVAREDWRPSTARQLIALCWREASARSDANGHWPADEARAAVARWLPAAVAGSWPARLLARVRSGLAWSRAAWHTHTASQDVLRTSVMASMNALVHAERLRSIAEWINTEGKTRSLEGTPDDGAGIWEPGEPTRLRTAGFHLPETWAEQPCVWSEPVAMVQLPLEAGTYDVVVQWLPVRPPDDPPEPSFYLNGRAPSGAESSVGRHSARFVLATGEASTSLGWVCRAFSAPGDVRALGLPLRRIAWRRSRPGRPLLMLHVRKTAGSAIGRVLTNRFHADRCLLMAHSRTHVAIDMNRYDFVTGHVGFNCLTRFARRPLIVTLLREPLDRALSMFYFCRENDADHLRQLEIDLDPEEYAQRARFTELANRFPLPEFLMNEPDLARAHLSNPFTRAMLDSPPEGPLEARHLEEAKGHLRSCDVIGLTERLDETMALLEHAIGWEASGAVPYFNRTRRRQSVSEEDPHAIATLTEWNRLDDELYAFACGLFEERLRGLRRRAAGRAALAQTHLPDARHFTFDQPIHGHGWHLRERHDERWICWTGSEETWIDLALDDPAPSVLSCRVRHAVSGEALKSARLLVNNRPVQLLARPDGDAVMLEANVRPELLYEFCDRVRITFAVSGISVPHENDPHNPERRPLGLALDAITLTPVG